MSAPYLVFSTLRADNDPTMQSWARFRNHIQSVHPVVGGLSELTAPVAAASSSPGQGVASYWRLLASNHRELARSYFLYDSYARARTHVEQILDDPGAIEIVTLVGSDVRTHGWYGVVGSGGPVITCSRWYGGSAAAFDAARASLRALATAVVMDGRRSSVAMSSSLRMTRPPLRESVIRQAAASGRAVRDRRP
ncbi:hypothetical protein ACFJGV_05815 [Cnuibacter sp. UC19_7]|uniref:hypothetical protein n=1 Tax=Cnuibacter sp. UC19_7 TaxID=3350166 RepID=UPI00366BAF38